MRQDDTFNLDHSRQRDLELKGHGHRISVAAQMFWYR